MPEYTGQVIPSEGAGAAQAKPYDGPVVPVDQKISYAQKHGISMPTKEMGLISSQMDPGIDYGGYPDNKAQAIYSLLNTPQEKTAYLVKTFGPQNVTKDSFGHDVVIRDGKRYAFQPRGYAERVGPSWSRHVGDVLPVGGMVAGGVIGGALGPGSAIVGSGAGAMAGSAGNRLIKDYFGLNQETSTEAAKGLVGDFAQGATAEGIGRGLGFAGRSVIGPYRPGSVFGPWKRNLPMYEKNVAPVKDAIEQGLRVRVGTAAPNAIFIQRLQNAGFRIFGDEIPQLNRPVLEKGAESLAARAAGPKGATGLTDAEALSSRLSAGTEGKALSAQAAADQARKQAETLLSQSQKWVTEQVGQPSGKLGASVSNDIRFAKDAFSQKASELYAPIDAAVGKPVVPTQGIKEVVNGILQRSAKTVTGEPVALPAEFVALAKKINALPDRISFQEMQGLRSAWSATSQPEALNVGLQQGRAKLLASAADNAFKQAESEVPGMVKQLRRADAFYKAGMKRFNDMSVEALVKDATQGGAIQPERVAQYVATPGQTSKLLRIKRVVSPDTFREIGAEKWSQMLQQSTDPVTGQIDGRKLSRYLFDMSKNGTLDVLYGSDTAGMMRTLGKQFAALDGKADASLLGHGNIRDSLLKAVRSQEQADALMSTGWVKAIRSNGPESLQAAQYLTNPNNRLAMRQFMETFGKDSPEAQSLREYLARQILSKMEQPATRGAEKYASTELMGQPLLEELNRYGRPYLNEVFGKEWTNDAYRFANLAEVASRKNPMDSGGLIAAMLGLHPVKYLGQLIHIYAGNELLSTPIAMRWMTDGIAKGPEAFFQMLADRQFFRAGIGAKVRDKTRDTEENIRGGAYRLRNEMTGGQPNAAAQGNQ